MKNLLTIILLAFPIWSWATTGLEVNGKEYTVQLDEFVKPYMANRILQTIVHVKGKEKTEAEKSLSKALGLSPKDDIDYFSLLPSELAFTTDTERKLICLRFQKEEREFELYYRMVFEQIQLIDSRVTPRAEPAVIVNAGTAPRRD